MDDSQAICDGCTVCATRCTNGIRISEFEYLRIVEELRALELNRAHKILGQSKTVVWFEEITYTACLFLDMESKLCLVYPARPLICRLFGRVRHLPCPIARAPQDLQADGALKIYTDLPLKTFQEWMMEHRVFNFDDLLGGPAPVPEFEL